MKKIFEVLESKTFDRISKSLQIAGLKKPTLPILDNVLIRQKGDFISLERTYCDRSLAFRIKKGTLCNADLTDPITVNSQDLKERTAGLEGFELLLSDDNKLYLRSESTTALQSGALFTDCILPADDYPVGLDVENIQSFASLDAEVFFKAIEQTIPFTCKEDTRAVLNGSYLIIEKNELQSVATDGRRMIIRSAKITAGTDKAAFIMRRDDIAALCKIAKLCKVRGSVSIFNNHKTYCVAFSVADAVAVWSGRILEGVYPSYKQVIPTELKHEIPINRDILENAVKSVKRFTKKPERDGVPVMINFASINGKFCAFDNAKEVLTELINTDCKLPLITFNLDFLLDAINNSSGAFIFSYTGEFNPALLKTESAAFVLMPLRPVSSARIDPDPAEIESEKKKELETVNA